MAKWMITLLLLGAVNLTSSIHINKEKEPPKLNCLADPDLQPMKKNLPSMFEGSEVHEMNPEFVKGQLNKGEKLGLLGGGNGVVNGKFIRPILTLAYSS